MKKISSSVIAFAIIMISYLATAQQPTVLDSINFYGSLRAHIAYYNQNVEMQNNASRIGFYLQRKIWKGITADGKVELGINLLKNNNTFNPDAATATDPSSFLVETVQPVTTRLGYIGLHKNKLGNLLIGKQWSTYYDVSEFTDWFNVFGASASGTYNTNTDGGGEGTGRAESAITYRNRWKNFSLGLQAQFPGGTFNFGGSMVYYLPKGFTVGAAYNYYDVPADVQQVVVNATKFANSFVAGVRFKSKKAYAAVCYAYNKSEAQYPDPSTAVAFAANGIEVYAHYYLKKDLLVYAGVNLLHPKGSPDSLSKDFQIFYFPVGAAYYFLPDFYCYAEGKIDAGTTATGKKSSSVFTLGLKYNFNFGHGELKIK